MTFLSRLRLIEKSLCGRYFTISIFPHRPRIKFVSFDVDFSSAEIKQKYKREMENVKLLTWKSVQRVSDKTFRRATIRLFVESYWHNAFLKLMKNVLRVSESLLYMQRSRRDLCAIQAGHVRSSSSAAVCVLSPRQLQNNPALRWFHRCGADSHPAPLIWVYGFHVCLSVLAENGDSWGFIFAELHVNKLLVPSYPDTRRVSSVSNTEEIVLCMKGCRCSPFRKGVQRKVTAKVAGTPRPLFGKLSTS